jgi:endoglucanase
MIGEPVAQAFHAYDPFRLTHYKASWVGDNEDWPVPEWPYSEGDGTTFGPETLAIQLAPWAEFARQGGGVHCGEFGAYHHTPHDVVLSWLEVVLEWLKAHDIGYALWNFRGPFGVLDSGRADVDYEDWDGAKLDRRFLELLRKY